MLAGKAACCMPADGTPHAGDSAHLASPALPSVFRPDCYALKAHMLTSERCRHGRMLHASDGKPRPGSEGGEVRYQFTRLPGTGAGSAKAWYQAGAR